jgi:hypothetical protein
MRRIVLLVTLGAMAFAAAAAAVLASVNLASPQTVADVLQSRLSAWTGTRVAIGSATGGGLLPSPLIELTDVAFSPRGSPGTVLTAAKATVSLHLLPLLSGQIDFDSLVLTDPRLHLASAGPDEPPAPTIAGLTNRVLSTLAGVQLDHLIVRGGRLVYDGRSGEAAAAMPLIDLNLTWQSAQRSLALAGSLSWQEEQLNFDAEIDKLPCVLCSDGAHFGLTLVAVPRSAPPAASHATPPGDTAAVPVPGRPLHKLINSVMSVAGPPANLQSVNLEGRVHVDPTSVTLSHLSIDPSNQTPLGWLSLRFRNGRPLLSGSLAVEDIPLGPIWGGLTPLDRLVPARSSETLLGQTLPTDWLGMADANLQLRVGSIDLGGGAINNAIASIVVRDGRLKAALEQAGVAGGTVTGALNLDGSGRANGGGSAALSLQATDVAVTSLIQMLWPAGIDQLLGTPPPVSGTGTATANLSAQGNSIKALLRSLAGDVALEVDDGRLNGADIKASLAQLVDGNLTIADGDKPFLPVGGSTNFSGLGIRMHFDGGTIRADQAWIHGDQFTASLSGTIDMASGDIAGDGKILMFATADHDRTASKPLIKLPVGIGGTLPAPNIIPGIPWLRAADDATSHTYRTQASTWTIK